MMTTKQMERWNGKFGKEYTKRNIDVKNNYTIPRSELNELFLNNLDRDMLILEVGCNIGNQLISLQKMGFKSLYGIELQQEAIELSKHKSKNINIVCGSAFNIPFRDGFFDLVFTSGLLIHISPDDIKSVLSEIYRCSKKFIWGLEYYANNYTEIVYHGKHNMLWKTDFETLYLDNFSDLRSVCEKKLKYSNSDNVDSMFLLEKQEKTDEINSNNIMRCRNWRYCKQYPSFCRYCARRRYIDFSDGREIT